MVYNYSMSELKNIISAFGASQRPQAIRLSRQLALECNTECMLKLAELLTKHNAFAALVDIWDRRRNSGLVNLHEDPAFAQALNQLALEHVNEGRYGAAIELLDRALNIEKNDINSRRNLASILLMVGDIESALIELDEVLTAAPDDPKSNELFGIALYQTGDPALAREPLETAFQSGSANAGLWLAKSLCIEDKLDYAVEVLQKLLNIAADRGPAMINAELEEPGSPLNRLQDTAGGGALLMSLGE